MPAPHTRSDVLVRLVARCDTAAAMPTRPTLPRRSLRLLLAALLLAASMVAAEAVPATAGSGATAGSKAAGLRAADSGTRPFPGSGAVDSGTRPFPGSAPLPLRGAQVSGVGLSRGPAAPRAGSGPGRVVRARYAILVDPQTGAVLWGRRSRTPVPPASLTKMLTALAVRASLDLDAVTVASKTAAAESARLGLRASSWRNPHGLDARGHRSTAFDLAILARAVLQDPWLARVVRKRHAAFISPSGRRHTLTARSRFLLGYRGAVGVKTGFTDDAGHCLAAAATRGGRTLIAVVLHSPDNAADAGRMLDWGFGRGRSAQTGLRLPGPVRPSSVAALLTRPPRAVERHQPAVPEALASAGLTRVGAAPAARPAGSRPAWTWRDRQRVATGAGAVVALLAALTLAVHRFRQRALLWRPLDRTYVRTE